MGAVGKAVKKVGSVAGKVGSFVFGGDSKPVQGANYAAMSDEEIARLQSIESEIERMFGEQGTLSKSSLAQSQEVQTLFADNLKNFLSGGSANPEIQAQNASYIDQLFTNPAQKVIDQNVANYEAQAQAKAASLGRNPNADVATQQAIAGEAIRQNIGLQAERGQRIQDLQTGQLNAGMQGGNYLSQLGQQAFTNRFNLLNQRSGLADFYQRQRSNTTTNNMSTSPGLLGNISNGLGQISKVGGQIGKIGAMFGGGGGGGMGGIG